MATTTTFETLVTDLQSYLERGLPTDPIVSAQIPRLINLAERKIATELKVQGFLRVVVVNLVAGQSVYDKPDSWRLTASMNIGTGSGFKKRTPVFGRGYEYLRAYWPDESAQGTPEIYADYDYDHWVFAPTPDAAYPLEVAYYAQLPLLDETNQSNWLTEIAPQLLLYGALLEAGPFLKDDERIATWQGLYDRAASALTGQDVSKILDRAAVRKEA